MPDRWWYISEKKFEIGQNWLIVISTPLKFSELAHPGVFKVKIGHFKIQFGL